MIVLHGSAPSRGATPKNIGKNIEEEAGISQGRLHHGGGTGLEVLEMMIDQERSENLQKKVPPPLQYAVVTPMEEENIRTATAATRAPPLPRTDDVTRATGEETAIVMANQLTESHLQDPPIQPPQNDPTPRSHPSKPPSPRPPLILPAAQ